MTNLACRLALRAQKTGMSSVDTAASDAAADASRERLTASLSAALLREVRDNYDSLNASFFKSQLRRPAMELSDSVSRLGLWSPATRILSLSRSLVIDAPWGEVLEVLKHEMAHQFVHEVLGITGETPHGPAFREVCQKLGIDARAAGTTVTEGDDPHDARILARIAKLMALAESDSANEAQAAMAAAQRLMLKYNLERIDVPSDKAVDYGFRHLGKPNGRVPESDRIISLILSEHFFVEAIWVPVYRPLENKRGSVLEICGSHANLEMASYVYSFLANAAEQLWREHKRSSGIAGNRDRRTYQAGVMSGFYTKLNRQRSESKRDGLVWVGDADLHRFYRRRHPHVQRARYTGNARTEAHGHGREAGARLVLHRPIKSGPSGARKLLTR